MNGYSYLTLEQRREIERMYAEGERVVDVDIHVRKSANYVADRLKRHVVCDPLHFHIE